MGRKDKSPTGLERRMGYLSVFEVSHNSPSCHQKLKLTLLSYKWNTVTPFSRDTAPKSPLDFPRSGFLGILHQVWMLLPLVWLPRNQKNILFFTYLLYSGGTSGTITTINILIQKGKKTGNIVRVSYPGHGEYLWVDLFSVL